MAGRERASLTSINLLSPSNFSHSLFPLLATSPATPFFTSFCFGLFPPTLCLCVCASARAWVRVFHLATSAQM